MTSRLSKHVSFASTEYELGVITALLHDVGKKVGHADERYCTGRLLTMGHELLGVELIRNRWVRCAFAQTDPGNAITPLL